MNLDDRIWDYTAINTFQHCRRKFYFFVIKGYRSKRVAPALEFGLAIHEALDAYYTSGLEEAAKIFRETYVDREGEDLRTVENGLKLLGHYSKVYANEPFKVIGTPEQGFVFPLGDILWGGRMDLPVLWDNEVWIVEHKTCARLDSNFFKQFKMDSQVTSYIMGAEEYLGRKCSGCIINALEPWKELIRPTAFPTLPHN